MAEQFVGREEFDMFVKHYETEQNEQNRRLNVLDEMSKSVNALALEMGKMNLTLSNMVQEIAEQGKRIGAIEKAPADKWDKVVQTIITTIVAGVVGFALAVFTK